MASSLIPKLGLIMAATKGHRHSVILIFVTN